jgi:phytoene synthase
VTPRPTDAALVPDAARGLDRDRDLADRAVCRAWIAAHSRSFYLSSLLLPAPVRHAAWALYAFCRRADDAVDAHDVRAPLARVEDRKSVV